MGDDEDYDGATANMTETEKALYAAKKKHEAEMERFIEEWTVQREEERAKLDMELEELKERQARRQEERMEDEARMAEMMHLAEERRRAEEEDRKKKQEDAKRKKEEDRKKKQALMQGGMGMMAGGDGKPNYVLPEKKTKSDESTGIKSMSGTGETPEDFQQAKADYLEQYKSDPPGLDELDATGLRQRVKALHKRICDLEAVRYDMEQRLKIQEMDFKELQERKKQKMRQKAMKKGLDPDAYAAAKHPFKISVASAFDRQTDRRSYTERKDVYAPKLRKNKTVYHGSGRPPIEWGRSRLEEIEILRKLMEDNPTKYEEAVPCENPVKPIKPIPMKAPEGDEVDAPPAPEPPPEPTGSDFAKSEPPAANEEAPATAAEPEPEPEPAAAEE